MLRVIVWEQVCVDVGVGGAGLTDAGTTVGDDVCLLGLTALHPDLRGILAHDVNIVIGVLHSDTAKNVSCQDESH